MPYLINPYGRIIAVGNQKDADELLKKPGFKLASDNEAREHILERMSMVNKMNAQQSPDKGMYFSSVSAGGKDGYSIASTLMIRELNKLGINTYTTYSGQKVALLFHNPYSIMRIEAPYRIIYTMFESDKIPDDWVDYLSAADKILVPSKWCRKVFGASKVVAEVLPLGYDDTMFTFKPRPNKRKTNQTFVFLHYNAFNIRKGFTEVFRAFT